MSSHSKAMLINGNDIIALINIIDSAEKVLKYIKGYSEDTILKSDKAIDAISFRLYMIGEEAHYITIEFTERFDQVDWQFFTFLSLGHRPTFLEDDVWEIIYGYDDDFCLSAQLKKIRTVYKNLEEYINSPEFLDYALSFKEFIEWKDKEGNFYYSGWEMEAERYAGCNNEIKLTNEELIKAIKLLINKKILDINSYRFSILQYLTSTKLAIADKCKNTDYRKKVLQNYESLLEATENTTKWRSEQNLPWNTDFPYPIKTKNSIWTVKKR
jgi:hypothetical protein